MRSPPLAGGDRGGVGSARISVLFKRRPLTLQKLVLIFCLLIATATPALADPLPAPEDLQKTLAADTATIGTYGLSAGIYTLGKDDLNVFYAVREYKPAWSFVGPENAAALHSFIDSISQTIAWHGLLREDYALDEMHSLGTSPDSDSRIKLELLVTDTLLRVAHDVHGDDADFAELYPGWNFKRADTDIPGDLVRAVAASSVNEYIDGLMPKNPAYSALARDLRRYNEIAIKGEWPRIDPGPILRPKDHGPRVGQLRARLIAEGYAAQAPAGDNKGYFFDADLAGAVADYQLHNGLDGDGNIGSATLEALNTPLAVRINQIRANMERWRHMPEDFPPARTIIVNIPDFSIDIRDNGQTVYRGPVIVGQVERKTPFIDSIIRSMIINPSWHVPEKIARADILPKLRKDPHYLEKLGFVIRGSDSDPHGKYIDWKNMADDEFNFHLRQQPGAMNSLGRLKFDFANDFAVYLHGTPHQELFKKNARALSSGCVRLRDPELVAEILLKGTAGDWNAGHIEDEVAARKTRWIEIKEPMPVSVVYWTVFPGEDGRVEFRRDLYDYDNFLIENLKAGLEATDSEQKPEIDPQAPANRL